VDAEARARIVFLPANGAFHRLLSLVVDGPIPDGCPGRLEARIVQQIGTVVKSVRAFIARSRGKRERGGALARVFDRGCPRRLPALSLQGGSGSGGGAFCSSCRSSARR
jgi:hypothetical protein